MSQRSSNKGKFSNDSIMHAETEAIKLVYSMRDRPQKEREQLLPIIKNQLKVALYRIISIVENTLQVKGQLQSVSSLIEDIAVIVDNLIKRNDLVSVCEYLLEFYQKTIDKIPDGVTINFYSQLVMIVQGEQTDAKNGATSKEKVVEKSKGLSMEASVEKTAVAEEKEPEQAHSIVTSNSRMDNEIEIVEDICIQKKILSEESILFIESFTAGVGSASEANGKAVKRYKIACLKPGEPVQKWEYFDSLQGGVVKVLFVSRKSAQ